MDIALLDAIQEHLRSPFMDTLMLSVTYLGDLAVVWFLAAAVLAASVFHFGELTVRQVKEHMASQGIPVRL